MAEKPILFSTPMVEAILDGRKTQTRRIVKPQPKEINPPIDSYYNIKWKNDLFAFPSDIVPYGKIYTGDMLYVREKFRLDFGAPCFFVKCHCGMNGVEGEKGWKPSIHMPKWAARIWLEITNIRVERIQDITVADCFAEGIKPEQYVSDNSILIAFQKLWNLINEKRGFGWDENPWVWVIEFKKIERR